MTTIAMTAAATLGIAGIKSWCFVGDPGGDFRCAAFYRNGHRAGAAGSFSDFEGNWGRAIVCGVLYLVCIFLLRKSWSLVLSAGK